jgi:hypothetical protein
VLGAEHGLPQFTFVIADRAAGGKAELAISAAGAVTAGQINF